MLDINVLNSIGEKINDARTEQGLTLEYVAKKADCSIATLYRIENYKIDSEEKAPRLDTLIKVSNVLELDICELLNIDRVSNNIEDFIGLFCKIQNSKDYRIELDGVINPEKLIYHSKNNYLILHMSKRLIGLFNDIAKINKSVQNINNKTTKNKRYTDMLVEAKNKYNKSKINLTNPYYLLSKKQLIRLIQLSVNSERYFKNLMNTIQSEEN